MSDNSDSDEYVVEQIVKKRTRAGKPEFLIKWKGCPPSDNSWEPEANLNCPELMDRFLAAEGKRRPRKRAAPNGEHQGQENRTDIEKPASQKKAKGPQGDPPKNGFEKGHVVEEIRGITQEGTTLNFLIKWKNIDEMEFVPSKVARKHVPEIIIDYYQSRIIWNPKEKENK